MDQHQPLLQAISRILRRLRIPHQAESGDLFTADRNLRVDIVYHRTRGLRDAKKPGVPRQGHPAKMETHADPQAPVDACMWQR